MAAKLKIYRGLPGSGKTSKARAEADQHTYHVLAGRDHIRRELGIVGGVGTPEQESEVSKIQDTRISEALRRGNTVHVDDMNLKERYVKHFIRLAEHLRIRQNIRLDVEVVDLREMPLDVCIFNDEVRKSEGGHYVGEARIRDLHRRYISHVAVGSTPVKKGRKGLPASYKPKPYEPDKDVEAVLPTVIVDIDGTVALKGPNRSFYDYDDRVLDDLPNPVIIQVVLALIAQRCHIVFLSGRMDSCEQATRTWIRRHITPRDFPLFMRKTGDTRPDYEVKDELFERHLRGKFRVRLAIDDRNQVVDLWRAKGITTLQVADGNF